MLADDLGLDVSEVVCIQLGLDGVQHGREFKIECPDPKHDDAAPSCDVNLDTGLWLCLSCGAKGDLPGLVALVWGLQKSEALQALQRPDRDSLLRYLGSRLREAPEVTQAPLPGPYEPGPLTYLRKRGFNQNTLELFECRYVYREVLTWTEEEDRTMVVGDSVAIPVHDDRGRQTAWCYRSTVPHSFLRYVYTPNAPLGSTWFNQHRVPKAEVVVVEGILDAMWLCQAGVSAIACMGSTPSPQKISKLARYDKVTILGDRDPAGIRMVRRIGEQLTGQVPVTVGRYPRRSKAMDPCELSAEEARYVVRHAVPWLAWSLRNRSSG